MSLRFILGASGSGKSYELHQEVIKQAGRDSNTNYLVIVPDQFTMQTQKELVLAHPNKGIMNIDVLSFNRLAHRVFDEVGGNDKPILDDTGKSLILRKIAGKQEDSLKVIGSNLKKIGYIHEVKSSISEFMQYNIGPKELEQLIAYTTANGSKKASLLTHKLQDLLVLYTDFMEYSKDKFITTEGVLSLLKNLLHRSEILHNSVIVLDGFTGFTPIQNSLIQELMVCTKEVIVTVLMDEREDPYQLDGEQKLFYLSKKTIYALEKAAKEKAIKRGTDRFIAGKPVIRYKNTSGLAHLEECIFRYENKVYDKECEEIKLIEANNLQDEIRLVAINILTLLREQNYKYQDIAVITGDLNGYSHIVKAEFSKFGIPCFIDSTKGILLNPFIEVMKGGIETVLQNFSYGAMFHFLRSGMLPIPSEEIDKLENYVLALGIRGKRQWQQIFTRRSKEMGEQASEALGLLNDTREKIIYYLEPLISPKATVGELARNLYEFSVRASLQEGLAQYEEQFLREGDMTKAKEYSQIYPLVMELLNQIVALLESEPMGLQEFTEILYAGFDEIQVGTIPQNADRVVVGDMERTRLKTIKALFFVGVNHGIIPKTGSSGGLLSDMEREFLKEGSFELTPTPREQMFAQRLYLYMNLTKPEQRLCLSYAKVNGEGKSLRPAYLISTIQQMFPKAVLIKSEEVSLQERLATPKDGLDYLMSALRAYAGNGLEEQGSLFSLLEWYKSQPEWKGLADKLVEAAFYTYRDNPLGKAVVEALYGNVLENSVSRLEKYVACAYAHFLEYGLHLQEREVYTFEKVDLGNVFHGVLELFSGKLADTDYTWFDFPVDVGEALLKESLESYTTEYGETILYSSSRNAYMIEGMRRILNRTVNTLQYQLKKGMFRPEAFEVSFSSLQDLDACQITLSEKEKMRLRGRIDRIDTLETEDKIYVKVIDYKSGKQSFDLVALYYGLQLQLVVYLNAAISREQAKHPNKEVLPGAMLYYHIKDPMVTTEGETLSPEQINEQLIRELKTEGLINSDRDVIDNLDTSLQQKSDVIPVEYKKDGAFTAASSVISKENLQQISSFVNHKIKTIGQEILQGNVGIHPYEMEQKEACTFCNFHSICGFDPKIQGFAKNKLEPLTKEEAIFKIAEESEQPEEVK